MIPVLPPCIPFPIPAEQLDDVVSKAKDWALMHGAGMRAKDTYNSSTMQVNKNWSIFVTQCSTYNISYCLSQIAPFILTPTAFPRKEFEKAVGLQVTLNELMHWVAHDHQFLEETLEQTIKVDEFTASLYKIYKSVNADGTNQVIVRVLSYLLA